MSYQMNLYGKTLETAYAFLSMTSAHKTWKYYQQLLAYQFLPEEELQYIQWIKLQKILSHAYNNVPLYKKKFVKAGIHPRDIKSLDDFRAIPFTTRQELSAERKGDVIADNYSGQKLTLIETSGTLEEKPFHLFIDTDGLNRKYALLLRNYSYFNWHFGKRMMSLWNKSHEDYKPFSERSLLKTIIYKFVHRKKHLPPFSENTALNGKQGAYYYSQIMKHKPHLLEADAVMLYYIAQYIEENNYAPLHVESISSATCVTTPLIRNKIGSMFGANVYNNYGPHEMEAIACECSEHKGLHQSIDSYVIEFVWDDRPASQGTLAELVITDLDNYAMPLIRYKTGDLAEAGIFKCSCRRTLPLMKDIQGRKADLLKTDKGIFSEYSMQEYFGKYKLEDQFQILQISPDRFRLSIIARPTDTSFDKIIFQIEEGLKQILGDRIILETEKVEAIACEKSGKFRFVKSIPKGW